MNVSLLISNYRIIVLIQVPKKVLGSLMLFKSSNEILRGSQEFIPKNGAEARLLKGKMFLRSPIALFIGPVGRRIPLKVKALSFGD